MSFFANMTAVVDINGRRIPLKRPFGLEGTVPQSDTGTETHNRKSDGPHSVELHQGSENW